MSQLDKDKIEMAFGVWFAESDPHFPSRTAAWHAAVEWRDKTIIDEVKKVHQIQGADGNWNADPYMCGMFNGIELVLAQLENREPEYRKLYDLAGLPPLREDSRLSSDEDLDDMAEASRLEYEEDKKNGVYGGT